MDNININDYKQFVTAERLARMEDVIGKRTRHLSIVMENLYDPGNTSAVIRSCDAFGIQDMHIIEIDNKFKVNRKITQGAHNWINLYKYSSSKQAIDNLHQNGYKVYFADPKPEYPSIDELPLTEKTAIIFGQEKPGIREETKKLADGGFRIPLYGFVESFNVSVACALSLFGLTSRIRKKPPEEFLLTKDEKEKIFTHWLVKNTAAGNVIKKLHKEKDFLLNEPFLI